ncbi:MAG: hypothetical protein AAF802_09380 [Planctomycetota bacterium]
MATQQNYFSFMEPTTGAEIAELPGSHSSQHSSQKPVDRHSLSRSSVRQNHSAEDSAEPISADDGNPRPRSRRQLVDSLRQKVGAVGSIRQRGADCFSTGCSVIDRWLPQGGLHPSTLTQWVGAHQSAAASSLSMIAASHRLRQIPNRPLVLVDCEGTLYPPAFVALGVPSERVVLLRPRSGSDAIWAIDQSLRCGAVAAVWASIPMQLDDRDARRLQLAAETGSTPGLLVRHFAARQKPSFAEVQFYVCEKRRSNGSSRSLDSQVRPAQEFETLTVTLDRVRGGPVGRHLDVRIDDDAAVFPVSRPSSTPEHETAAQHLASQLAHPAVAKPMEVQRRNAS